jgi:prepilin-type processing-associated H-X9-DG protein
LLPYIEQDNVWAQFTNPSINGTTYPMITRGVNPMVITHNLIRGQFVANGTMQAKVPIYTCPSRRPRVVREQDGNNVTEGIASDYGVNYGSGTTTDENNNGVFEFSCGDCGIGRPFAAITDGLSNTLLVGEKHVTLAGLGIFNASTGADNDFSIYSSQPGKWAYVTGRKAGTAFPLAQDKTTPFIGQFGSWHSGVVMFAFADGSVRPLKTSVPGSVLALLSARSDGQVIPDY